MMFIRTRLHLLYSACEKIKAPLTLRIDTQVDWAHRRNITSLVEMANNP